MRGPVVPLLGLASLAAACALPGAGGEPDAPRPNIVLVLADDLGWGDLGCYSPASRIPTPHLDGLAAGGLRFTDAHSPSSVCSPTRYGILTGRYAWRTELAESVVWEWGRPLLEPERTTLPELLGAAGYRTACIGKWHLGWTWHDADGAVVNADVPYLPRESPERAAAAARVDVAQPMTDGPLAHGFDHYFGDDVPNFPPRAWIVDDRLVTAATEPKPAGLFGVDGPTTPGWDLAAVLPGLRDHAVAWIGEAAAAGEPFFLYLPLTAPHTPIAPAPDFLGSTAAGAYGDYVHEVDDLVGQVLAALEAAGVADETLVVFTSDNGSPARDGTGMSGPVGSVVERFGHDPSGPWRGVKADIWEGGHRVPLLVRWPGRVAPGGTSAALVGLQDLYPTLAEALGLGVPAGNAEDAASFRASLADPAAPAREELVHHSLHGTFALRSGRWKLVEGNLASGGFSTPWRRDPVEGGPGGQLYDLATDPLETTDLWLERPDVVASLRARLAALRARD